MNNITVLISNDTKCAVYYFKSYHRIIICIFDDIHWITQNKNPEPSIVTKAASVLNGKKRELLKDRKARKYQLVIETTVFFLNFSN